MAVDRPADYVGNHDGAYTDIDGMRKQFTYIDHDKKVMVMDGYTDAPEEGWQSKYRASLIERITSMSASLCPEPFQNYTKREAGLQQIEWNIDMLLDQGSGIWVLRDLAVLVENKNDMVRIPR